MLQLPSQDPTDFLKNSVDYSLWLGDEETVSDSSWGQSGGVTLSNPQIETGDRRTSIWITGGTAGTVATLTNTITTTLGQVHKTTVLLPIEAN